ncbi:LPXTG cell wall anchor domain-containing protein [Rubneribacter badeniensis]|uniref:LPXTG cell wall anchor domain-containing protein n=1 Tax=Rubneribacter badeniensis TaxID=2070688 RepID=UPI003A9167A0
MNDMLRLQAASKQVPEGTPLLPETPLTKLAKTGDGGALLASALGSPVTVATGAGALALRRQRRMRFHRAPR